MDPDLSTLWPFRAVRPSGFPHFAFFLACILAFALAAFADDHSQIPAKPVKPVELAAAPQRTFRTFLPKPGETIDDPASQVVQVLLDRQDKGDVESYMVQVLFRGPPSARSLRVLSDRVEIDFYDTGKPSMRLNKIRGGAVEASSVDEFFYKDNAAKPDSLAKTPKASVPPRIKRMVRLTLFMHAKAEIKFRDTLDRTLIHFVLPKPGAQGKRDGK